MPHVVVDDLELPDGEQGPFEAALGDERRRVVFALLEELPDVYRTAIYLHYWLGATMDEAGELLGVPSGTVKSYLSRARERLRIAARAAGIPLSIRARPGTIQEDDRENRGVQKRSCDD